MGSESIAHEAEGNQNAALIIDRYLDFTKTGKVPAAHVIQKLTQVTPSGNALSVETKKNRDCGLRLTWPS